MRIVIQRVREAVCRVYGAAGGTEGAGGGANSTGGLVFESRIGAGLLLLVGVEHGDGAGDAAWLAGKVARMRLFPAAVAKLGDGTANGTAGAKNGTAGAVSGPKGDMEASVAEAGGEVMAVSQFTLLASTRKGNRPSWSRAAPGPVSEPLYEAFCRELEALLGQPVRRGLFGADMKLSLTNDGPVTIVIDSKLRE